MTYFPDLTPYVYFRSPGKGKNIGWLDVEHQFPTGNVAPEVLRELRAIQPRNLTKGFEFCPLCRNARGNGEIHIYTSPGVFYASPVLIVHYIETHDYLPPQEFIDAVRQRSKHKGEIK